MNIIKRKLIDIFNLFIQRPEVRSNIITKTQLEPHRLSAIRNCAPPYYPNTQSASETRLRQDPVFITGRFRSGSTLLWNVFRQLPGCKAYYEPFNERRWFDTSARGERVDESHIGVNDYWQEYNDLGHLAQWYNERWIDTDLMMSDKTWAPSMQAYIESLIESSGDNRPVLQFNRIDFRLPWIKTLFPNACLIHIYRNPRDQFLSFLKDKTTMNSKSVHHSYEDAFYLDVWCEDLKIHFPFLDKQDSPHPYSRFYYLWKLSYLYGRRYSDLSIGYEKLCNETATTLGEIFSAAKLGTDIPDACFKVFTPCHSEKWKGYADEHWFASKEAECEKVLTIFLNTQESQ